jgi:hypothetical protein
MNCILSHPATHSRPLSPLRYGWQYRHGGIARQEEFPFQIELLLSVQGFPCAGGSASFRSEPKTKGLLQGLDPLSQEEKGRCRYFAKFIRTAPTGVDRCERQVKNEREGWAAFRARA